MKKIINVLVIVILILFVGCNTIYAKGKEKKVPVEAEVISSVESYDSVLGSEMVNNIIIQKHISKIGLKLLNANKIGKRMVFVYRPQKVKIKGEPGLTKRQIVVYDENIQFAQDNNEIAAYLAREICKSSESYHGMGQGSLTSVQIKAAPKKYELFFDKRAVDYMVNAGFNPVALITFINKTYPQKRYDKISHHNLTSKRLAIIYEYIYKQYPYFLANNEYLTDESYQNFLLNSIDNRKKLYDSIKTNSKKAVKYE